MHTAWQDIRYAIRTLGRTPGFTPVALLTLALGIGATTAIFSVAYAVLFAPLPYARPSELMALYETLPPKGDEPARPTMPITPATSRDWSLASSFRAIAAYAPEEFILTGAGEPERVRGASVGWTFFDTMGTAPFAGRFPNREDDHPDRPRVAVLGHDLWRTRFGADAAIVGGTIELSSRRYTVVGVAQPGFVFPAASQLWAPLALLPTAFR